MTRPQPSDGTSLSELHAGPWWQPAGIATAAVGRSHGTSRQAGFDRWFRYPAGFASDYAERIFAAIGVTSGTVVDPFMGSGVAGTAARSRGLNFVGIEAHPLIADLAQAKLHINANPTAISQQAELVIERASARLSHMSEGIKAKLVAGETNLVTRSFDPLVLSELICIREQIQALQAAPESRYLKWALLGTLRDVASVKVGWPYQRPGLPRQPRFVKVTERFMSRLSEITEDIGALSNKQTRATILCGDSSASETWAAWTGSGNASVSSPPYLNNFDYADATRLEMYFWGMASTWKELCDTARRSMMTATTQQSSKPAMLSALDALDELGTAAAEIKDLTAQLTDQRAQKGSRAKQYDQVAPVYFLQMQAVLNSMAHKLTDSARCAWLVGDSAPYGIYIDTPRLIGELAESVGYVVRADFLLRKRGHRWTASGQRHDVQLGERLLIFERVTTK